jgi:hypothetical protein
MSHGYLSIGPEFALFTMTPSMIGQIDYQWRDELIGGRSGQRLAPASCPSLSNNPAKYQDAIRRWFGSARPD